MMTSGSRSLMDFVDAPVLVGDPDGRAVYVNPAFERCFATTRESVTGVPLAGLFEGGAREAVLRAVVQVCGGEPPARFRLREGGKGWIALASPVEVEEGRVGVVILLTREPSGEGRLLTFGREIREPLDELADYLAELTEQTGGRRELHHHEVLTDALRTVERMRKWASSIETEIRSER